MAIIVLCYHVNVWFSNFNVDAYECNEIYV